MNADTLKLQTFLKERAVEAATESDNLAVASGRLLKALKASSKWPSLQPLILEEWAHTAINNANWVIRQRSSSSSAPTPPIATTSYVAPVSRQPLTGATLQRAKDYWDKVNWLALPFGGGTLANISAAKLRRNGESLQKKAEAGIITARFQLEAADAIEAGKRDNATFAAIARRLNYKPGKSNTP